MTCSYEVLGVLVRNVKLGKGLNLGTDSGIDPVHLHKNVAKSELRMDWN